MINRINFLLTTLLITAFTLLWLGYQFGHNDQVETMSYVLLLQDKTLFQNDLFMQSLAAHEPNERSAFVYFMLPFANCLETATFVLHVLFLSILVAALLRIARLFIGNRLLGAAVVFVSLSIGYMITLGGVDLYYNTFQGGNIAIAICAWAIFFFLTKRYKRAAILLAIASPFQILVGLNTFLLLSLMLFADLIFPAVQSIKSTAVKRFLQFIAIYICTAGIYFFLVILKKQQADCNLSNKEFFDLIFDFRNAHHFLIAHFPAKKSLLFVSLYTMGLIAAYRVHKAIFKFLLAGGLLVLLYTIVTETTHWVPVASFQFYILTAWLKFFALIAAFAMLSKVLPKISIPSIYTLLLLSVVLLVTSTGSATNQLQRKNIPYEFGSSYKTANAEIDICIKAKSLSDKGALFIHPFEFSALKYFGQRSAYAEFKAGLHQKCGVKEWHNRLQEVYGINYKMKEKGFALQEIANTHLQNLSADEWKVLKLKGITHAILPIDATLNFDDAKQLQTNSAYTIWKL